MDWGSHRDRYLDYGGDGCLKETGTETMVDWGGSHRDRFLDYGELGVS